MVVSQDVYGGTYRVLTTLFRRWGLEVTFVDSSVPEQVEKAVRRNTRALYVETPSNPLLKITDLKAVVEIARRHGLLTIIDNTFMTPYLQRPLALGFDIVIHSATKFLGGHSDLIAGLVVTADEKTGKKLKFIQNAFGAILGPPGLLVAAPRDENLSGARGSSAGGSSEAGSLVEGTKRD
ncbi:MAG: cysteine-S-conjugate beta-lyase [Eubacteriales bacterium]|nr:cysteine-S-conjugate beta-lyase [Eubacteriales bacterium]MDN5363367.1 cysteine-S-conjugate beta-lyase [Eubacteriales bacterium]